MERELVQLLPYILGSMFALGVLLYLLAMQQLRKRRTGSYWRMRRQAGERGGRLFVLSVLTLVASVVLTVASVIVLAVRPVSDGQIRGPEDLYGVNLQTPEALTATGAAVMTLVEQHAETQAAATNAAAVVAAAATLAPTSTLDFVALLNTPRPTDASFRLRIAAASNQYVEDVETTQMRQFPAGTTRIYVYVSFENMENGVQWTQQLYHDGMVSEERTQPWTLGTEGNGYFFFNADEGFEAGGYEIRLSVGDKQTSSYDFRVDA